MPACRHFRDPSAAFHTPWAVACRQEVETSAELDSEESRAVLAENALKLFPRLAVRAPKEAESLPPPAN